jgi:hypothetical protein
MRDQARQQEAVARPVLEYLLDERQHCVLIEVALPEISLGPDPYLELAALLGSCNVDPRRIQAP